jgi:hypothetical protein
VKLGAIEVLFDSTLIPVGWIYSNSSRLFLFMQGIDIVKPVTYTVIQLSLYEDKRRRSAIEVIIDKPDAAMRGVVDLDDYAKGTWLPMHLRGT